MSLATFNIDSFVESYAPSESTFELPLPGGEVLTFRILQSYADLQTFKQAASNWYSKLPKAVGKEHPFYGRLPQNASDAMAAFTISELSVEPKLEHLDALKILAAPWLVETILSAIDTHNKALSKLWEAKAVDAAKKNFSETTGNGSGSQSAGTRSKSTRTSSRQKKP